MKKIGLYTAILLISLPGFSQNFMGSWLGNLVINDALKLRIVFNIKTDGKGNYSATADSPDQGAYGLSCESTTVDGKQLTIAMTSLNATFTGKLVNDTTIEGEFTQGGTIPLTLTRSVKVEKKNRPQTPQPPFPYKTEDISYTNAAGSIRYAATLTLPEGSGPFPAIVLITGSGPQDRDETIFEHKPFAVLADRLTRQGYMVLRADDRGVGKSGGNFATATSADFAEDVNAHLDYLRGRPETDKSKMGMIGHSEGGMIAPLVATQRKDIAFIILMAGPGVPITELMAAQNEAVARAGGVSEAAAKEIRPLFKRVAGGIMEAPDSVAAFTNVSFLLENWVKEKPAAIVEELNFETAPKRTAYINEMVRDFRTPWFSYFMRFDPASYLEKLSCKVLALNGDKDIQVLASQNLPGIAAALKKSKSPAYEIKELPGLNHLFQSCHTCKVEEYGELEETIAPAALEIIGQWLKKNGQ